MLIGGPILCFAIDKAASAEQSVAEHERDTGQTDKRIKPSIPSLFVNLGPLGLSYILSAGGSGYFRVRAVQPHIASGRLHLVPRAPQFSFPIYVVYSADGDDAVLGPALAGLRTVSYRPGRIIRLSATLRRTIVVRTLEFANELLGVATSQKIDLQTWPMLRRVHDRDVDQSACNMIDQILRHVDVDARGNIPERAAHP